MTSAEPLHVAVISPYPPAGEHYGGHRCAGEWITISLLETAVSFLARSLRYTVPPQPLRVSLSRMPAEPRSRFVIRDVRLN